MKENRLKQPIIIVGAPRSGTSLLQKIIREHPGFISVAKESGIIWQQYVAPELHNWDSEKFDLQNINKQIINDIRKQFLQFAMPSSLWTSVSRFNIMKYQRNPYLAPVFKQAYKTLASIYSIFPKMDKNLKLVDKSVHSGLWLDFVDHIFPDAKYIHIKRDGMQTIPSMIDGWLNPDRFFTYKLPAKLSIPDYPYERWNFALPHGWKDYTDKPLHEVVSFQWLSLQESIMNYFNSDRFEGRTLSIRLEDLTSETKSTLKEIIKFIDIDNDSYFDTLAENLPVINARPNNKETTNWHKKNPDYKIQIEEIITPMQFRLGYSGQNQQTEDYLATTRDT